MIKKNIVLKFLIQKKNFKIKKLKKSTTIIDFNKYKYKKVIENKIILKKIL